MTFSEDGASLRILVAEDNSDCAETLAVLLRLDGYEVAVAGDGPTALEMADTEHPDVLLLDLGLPHLSGYEVARRLTAPRPRRTPLVIAVTGYGREEDRARGFQSGIDLHLTKPVDPALLRMVLRRFALTLGPTVREATPQS